MNQLTKSSSPLIVGVGASGGGLDAFLELMSSLGDAQNLSIVIVLHQDQETSESLPEIVARSTSLTVFNVSGRKKIKAGAVYICAPATFFEVQHGVLRIAKPQDDENSATPIDFLFQSIAQDQGDRGVGIILSGNGSDGTLGLKAISDAGGMTLAQSAETARYDSMPRSAATTGVADHILSPIAIASELSKYASYLNSLEGEISETLSLKQIQQAIPDISKRLLEVTNHNFQHYKSNTLARRIRRRLQVLKLQNVEAYVQFLVADLEEPKTLFRELLISVTAFFRDPGVFEFLSQTVIPNLFANRNANDVVRFWVPGCATGEEAYSLAMLCCEQLSQMESKPEVQIFATDIDERALKICRMGVYPVGIEEDISEDRLRRFFIKRGNKYQLVKQVRELVLFSAHNLISDPPFSRLDLISCRNLLIYLGPHLQKKLIPLFHYALRPAGFLVLGPSENISSHGELFRVIDAKHRISQRKGTGVDATAVLAVSEGGMQLSDAGQAPHASQDVAEDLLQIMQRIVLDEFAPKSVIVKEDGRVLCASADMHKYLSVRSGNFQNNVIKLAHDGLKIGLRAALHDAKTMRRRIVREGLSVRVEDALQQVMVTVQPMPRVGEDDELFMIVFHDVGLPLSPGDRGEAAVTDRLHAQGASIGKEAESIVTHLEKELASTRVELEKSIQEFESANEELKSSNEELLSLNEEMQSANEELETSKEEIQTAVNALEQSNSDLENLLRSTQIATIFLDDELRIRSFTPAATAIYGLIPTDIGRPLANLMPLADRIPLLPDPTSVTGKNAIEHTFQTSAGRWFVRRVLPYRTQHGERNGIVVTFNDVTDLHEGQQRFASLVEASAQIVWETDATGKVCKDSPSWRSFTGQSLEQWLGNSWLDALHPDYRESTIETWQKAVSAGTPFSFRYPLWHHTGTWRWTQASAVPLRDGRGEIRSWVGMNTDIEDQTQSQLEIEQRERQIRSLISSTAEGIYGMDFDGNCTFANAACATLLGFESPDELLGKKMHILAHHTRVDGTSYPVEECKIYRAFREGAQVHVDDELYWRRDGTSFDVEYWAYPQMQDDQLVGCVVTFIDITERKKLAKELADRESHLRRVIDNMLCFVGVLDTAGTLQEVNKTALLAGDLTRDEVIGKPFWNCYWWNYDKQVVQDLKAAVATALGGELVRYDVEVRMAGDSRLTIDFMLAPVKDKNGVVTHLIPSGVDISERKWVELEIQQRVAQLDLALESGRMGILEWDIAVDRVTLSPQLYDMFGLTEETFLSTFAGFLNVIHPEDRLSIEQMRESAFTSPSIHHEVEFRVIRGDNEEIVWTHCRGNMRRDSKGNPLSILSVASDITERKQRELSLAFLTDLHGRLSTLTAADAIIAEASKSISEYLRLSHFLVIEMDTNAERATVIYDYCKDNSVDLYGVYDMSEFATDDERQRLAAGLPMILNDTADTSRPPKYIKNFAELQIGSIVNAPSNRDKQLQFMVSVAKSHPHVWRDCEVSLVRQISNLIRLKMERAQAEVALRESEERFRDLADNISQFTWMADANFSVFWYNQRWFDYTGTTLDQMQGWGWTSVHHPAHVDRVIEKIQQALNAGEIWEDTFPLRSKDGHFRWFLSRARPIRDAEGKILRWFGTNTDITDAKHAAEALQESQARLRLGIEVAEFALAQIDYATDSVVLSPEAAKLFGWGASETEVTRDQIHATFHPDDRVMLLDHLKQCLEFDRGGELAIEHRIVLPTGAVRWLSIRKRVFFDSSTHPPRPINGILAARDVTDHKHWEIELADRESHLRRVINNQLGLVGMIDRNGILVEVDDRFLSIAGVTREDVIGEHFAECAWWTYDPEISNNLRQAMIRAFAGETVRYDVALYAKDNQRLMIDFMLAPVRGDKGDVEFLIPSGVDISERKVAEVQLEYARAMAETANQSKSEFLANMSHEIRTPMTAILGYTDLIAEKLEDTEALDYVRTIRRNGDFLLDIINDILDLSKIEAGKFEVSQQLFSPQRLVEDVRSIMEVRAASSQIELNVVYDGLIPEKIESDPKRLRQILINLVGNAIKFTPMGTVNVVVSYAEGSRLMRFDVVDTGIGISDKQKKRLFQAFSQGDGNVNREFGGTGLGLAISKRLTEMLGGEIAVETELGTGSKFTVTVATGNVLPMVLVSPTRESSEETSKHLTDQIRLDCHILIVDDRRDIRFLSSKFLTDAGATVHEAENGEIAVAAVTQAMEKGQTYDLVLLDMQMPIMDGYETAKALRKLGYSEPIVALTADAMQGDMNRCIESGCNDYLSKPIDKTLLLQLVKELTS